MSSSIGFNLSNAVVPEIRKANNTFKKVFRFLILVQKLLFVLLYINILLYIVYKQYLLV